MATACLETSTAIVKTPSNALPMLPPGCGHAVHVKNTFIEIDDPPPTKPTLFRTFTAPPGSARSCSGVETPSSRKDAAVPPQAGPLRQHDEATEGTLERTVTPDCWEAEGWVHASMLPNSSQPGMVPALTPAAYLEGKWQPLPLRQEEPSPPPTTPPRVTGDEWAPVPLKPHAVYAATLSWPAPASASAMIAVSPAAPAMAKPQTLPMEFCDETGYFRTLWRADARKLRGNERNAVSPPFETMPFKMILYPKGGVSFKKAKGKGLVQLKCEADLPEATANFRFRVSIGTGEKQQAARGPKVHNFAACAVCGLDKDEEDWDFESVVDPESATFVVCLEIEFLADAQLKQA